MRHFLWILVFGAMLLMVGCNSPIQSAGGESAAMELATQEQGMGSAGGGSGDGSGEGSQGGYSFSPPGAQARPAECIVPEVVINNNWFNEDFPQKEAIIAGCPRDNAWHATLKVTHNWHQEQAYGYFDVDASTPAIVELTIYTDGSVLQDGAEPGEYPVKISGEQTLGETVCKQEGGGYYTINIKGTCRDGWLILSTFKMPFISSNNGKTRLWCDDDEPIEVDSFVPDASPALTPCFVISKDLTHGVNLKYDDGAGGTMSTWLIMKVPDANALDTIVPLK